jgi:hypothetical protein
MVECPAIGGSMVGTEAMTCQELLALSGALSAALPTGQLGLGSFFTSLSKGGKFAGCSRRRAPQNLGCRPSSQKIKMKKKIFCRHCDVNNFA